jgi:hypothetical protein
VLLSHHAATAVLSSPSTCASPGTCATPSRKGLTLLFDAAAIVTPIQVTPTAVDAKRSALTSLGVDVENGNRLTLLAASRESLEFLMDGKQTLAMQCWNDRELVVVQPPRTHTTKAFVENAKKSGWIEALLTTDEQRLGMIKYLSSAKDKKGIVMDTYPVDALATILQLSGNQVRHVRAYANLKLDTRHPNSKRNGGRRTSV